MSTYAIGDIQGCFAALEALLGLIAFNPKHDTLWFTGDLVNRGPQSLTVLRYIKSLGPRHRIILGNHDLHLLAVYFKTRDADRADTLNDILTAHDATELIDWLRAQPLIHHDATLCYTMVHAGLAPTWDLATAHRLAKEVETVLQGDNLQPFLTAMYGDTPNHWQETLRGFDRLRVITNYFTRARFCYADGSLELSEKSALPTVEKTGLSNIYPWFRHPARKTANENIIFGHWAALAGITDTPHVFGLDTGCVWGFRLTAMELNTGTRYSVPCIKMQEI